ncbi:hypothetical protein QFC20_003295 [Naganishia adeliensis]|uniref:Uncharacterized protein n=1 Tax=Naganishia adeliensis TaxID=92952 RepID=A0ACC2WEA7_9TREE|nr:hypothetical protein QFC20_003295 [Naganishia adeliensis]
MDTAGAPSLPSLLLETYHDSHPQSPPPDLSTKQSTEYLTRLTGYSLNSLTSEPSRIADEHAFVGRELTSLCIGEYKSFVAVHQCKEQVKGALDEFDASLEELRRAIPELERECAMFVQETSGIQADRRRAQIVLEHQDKLVDLLDIPQLVDTCVRNGYYHEAMELTSHTRQLVERHPDVPLVHSISTQVDSIMQLQLSQLVASLREPVKLPILVKSIGFLRKMASLEEDELRLAFLESRAQRWRDHVKEHVDKERHDPTRYIRRYVDAFRELQYDTVVQYTAIFLDPASFRNTSRRTTSGTPAGLDEASRVQALDLIVRYAHHAVSDLLHCIATYIPAITDPSSLSSLLTQLGYTALSFSRVGMDFSAYLPEVFEHAVQELTTSSWNEALRHVMERLKPTLTTQRTASPSGQADIEAVFVPGFLVSPAGLSALTRSEPPAFVPPIHKHSGSKTVPPLYLTSYPLLATYTNSIVTTLNSLRLLAPIALFPILYAKLLDNLATFGQALLDYAIQVTGQADPALGPPTRKRPEGLRRNTSISNRDQLAERTQARERHGKRILSALLDAYVNGCVDFLKTALVEGVYAGQFQRVQHVESEKRGVVGGSEERLASVVAQLQDWVARHVEETAGKKTEQPKGIDEEEVPAEKKLDSMPEAEVAEQEDIKLPAEPVTIADTGPEPRQMDTTEGYSLNDPALNDPTLRQGESDAKLEPSASPQPPTDAKETASEEDPSSADVVSQSQPPVSAPVEEVAEASPQMPLPAEATVEIQQPTTPKVIEKVLEVGIEIPATVGSEDISDPSANEQGIPVQITEEVQIPAQDSAEPSLKDAEPVSVVPDTSTDSLPAEIGINAAGREDDVDIVDRLIAAKEEAEVALERLEEGGQNADQNGASELPQEPEIGSQGTSLPPAQPDESERADTAKDRATIDMPLTKDSDLAPNGLSDSAQGTDNITNRSVTPVSTRAMPPFTTTGAIDQATVQPSTIDQPARAEPETTAVSDPLETAAEALDVGEEDLLSGVVTPENEAEDPGLPPTAPNTENAAGGKSKKKKNKKKGKK